MAPMAGPCWCGSPNGGSDAWCIHMAVLPGPLYSLSCISRGCFLYPPSMPAVCGLYQLYWLWMLSGCCWAYLLAQACSSAKAPGAHICTTSLTPPGATQPRISPECHQKANGGGRGDRAGLGLPANLLLEIKVVVVLLCELLVSWSLI